MKGTKEFPILNMDELDDLCDKSPEEDIPPEEIWDRVNRNNKEKERKKG